MYWGLLAIYLFLTEYISFETLQKKKILNNLEDTNLVPFSSSNPSPAYLEAFFRFHEISRINC